MDSYLVVMFLMLIALTAIVFELHSINHKETVINNYIEYEQTPKDEITEEEIEDMLEAGVYRPSPEDLAAYYAERHLQDKAAGYNPYDNEEMQDMLNG